MQGVAAEKVQGGKLVRVRVDYGEKINDVKITGDFFLHPEEGIADMEKSLSGLEKNIQEEEIADKIREVVRSKDITLIGVTEDAVARLVKEAMK